MIYELYHSKIDSTIRIQECPKKYEYTKEYRKAQKTILPVCYNNNSFFCSIRIFLVGKAKSIRKQWIAEAQAEMDRIMGIEV